jgi:glutathione S-transferase
MHGVMWAFIMKMFPATWADALDEGLTVVRGCFEQLIAVKGDYKFFAGNEPTYADFYAYEFLDKVRTIDAATLEAYPQLTEFMATMLALDHMAEFEASQSTLLPFAPFLGWQKDHMPS